MLVVNMIPYRTETFSFDIITLSALISRDDSKALDRGRTVGRLWKLGLTTCNGRYGLDEGLVFFHRGLMLTIQVGGQS